MSDKKDVLEDALSQQIQLASKPYKIESESSSCYLIREMPEEEKPREKMQKYGNESLSNAELLALVMGTGAQGLSVIDLARSLLLNFNGALDQLARASIDELCQVKGIGPAKATSLRAVFALAQRLQLARSDLKSFSANQPHLLAQRLIPRFEHLDHEEFWVLLLDTKLRIKREVLVTRGILDRSPVHAREVFREAVKAQTAKIILVHNHPSGDPSPSASDIEITKDLSAAGTILGIDVIDHLVIGGGSGRWCSFREQGLM